jgi:replicative DNA helicase
MKGKNTLDDAGDTEYINYLRVYSNAGVDYKFYSSIIKKTHELRQIIYTANSAVSSSCDKLADPDDIIRELQKKIYQIQGIAQKELKTSHQILANYQNGKTFHDHYEWVTDQVSKGLPPYIGVSSGYKILDETLGFFRPSCFYLIGGRTSMGKTTFLLNLIKNMNSFGRRTRIGFFSLEMPANVLIGKMMSLYTGISFNRLEDGFCKPEELQRFYTQADSFKDYPIYIEDQSGLKISQLSARAKRMKEMYNIEILFIDYLTLIKSDDKLNSKHLEVDQISKGLQNLAKDLQIPIIVLAQLNREVTKRADNKPLLSDFRESGSIEEDADACLLIHRPDYYDKNANPGVVQLHVAKNRIRGDVRRIDFKHSSDNSYEELVMIDDLVEQRRKEEDAFQGDY